MENDVFSKPKRTDSVKEILEMQEKFFSEKKKNKNFQPAAQVTWVDKGCIYIIIHIIYYLNNFKCFHFEGKKQSLFAKSRLIKETEKEESKSLDISNIILGDVVEKPTIQHFDMVIKNSHEKDSIEESGFPKVERVKIKVSLLKFFFNFFFLKFACCICYNLHSIYINIKNLIFL